MWETFEHISDIGIRGIGANFNEAFSEAAKCMFDQIADISAFDNGFEVETDCDGSDRETLFVDFLNKLLYESAVNRAVFIEFIIQDSSDTALRVKAKGEKILSRHKYFLKTEVKAATYSQLRVYRDGDKYIAECIIDV